MNTRPHPSQPIPEVPDHTPISTNIKNTLTPIDAMDRPYINNSLKPLYQRLLDSFSLPHFKKAYFMNNTAKNHIGIVLQGCDPFIKEELEQWTNTGLKTIDSKAEGIITKINENHYQMRKKTFFPTRKRLDIYLH